MVQLMFFGRFSDIEENREMALPDGMTDTQALIDWLSRSNPAFSELVCVPGVQIVLNNNVIRGAHDIKDSDEIGFLSPMSGG